MKEIISTITSKGQVTVPAEVRKHLGLSPRDKIAFIIDDVGDVRLESPRYPDIASLQGAAGSLGRPLPWDRVMEIAHEDRLMAKYQNQS